MYAGLVRQSCGRHRRILAPFRRIASREKSQPISLFFNNFALTNTILKTDNLRSKTRHLSDCQRYVRVRGAARRLQEQFKMANTQGQQGQGSSSGTRSNQDPSQKSGSGQHSQQGNQGNQGNKPNDMNQDSTRGGQPGSGSQHSGSGSSSGNR
jgi:hypothetical protein